MKKIIIALFFVVIIFIGVTQYRNIPSINTKQTLENIYESKILGKQESEVDSEIIVRELDIKDFAVPNENITTSAWIPYWDYRGFDTVSEIGDYINSVSPVWFYVNPDGTLSERDNYQFNQRVSDVHDTDVMIIPSITNPSPVELSTIINDNNLRAKHIREIISKVENYNFDGIDIDYENLNGEDTEAFSGFIEELADALHARSKLLTIAVLPKSDNLIYKFSASRIAQDWKRIGNAVNELRIMGYDWTHNSTTDSGPISPTEWLREILDYAVDLDFEPSKIVLGLPLYGYYWQNNGVSALTWEDTENLNGNLTWDQSAQSNKLSTSTGEAWYHDSRTIEVRRELAREYGLKGVVYWRMGGEDPNIWNLE